MVDARRCPNCGKELPGDAPGALCPRCLLQAGFASEEARADERMEATESHRGTSSPSFTPPTPADLASRFPQLEILELLGQGGMGAVYKARQPGLDRLVAVKILPPCAGRDPAFAERFAREARAMARLSHPHIVNVYDFGHADGQFFLVMEYVDGVNLRQAIRAQSVSPETALTIVTQVCDALQYAHDEGVVHRDIKPENILLDKRGRVKIADFGLAKLLGAAGDASELTGTQQVMGTLRYMAPEQMEGSRNVDHRADIYSLGVVFYELLTGEVPMGRFQPPSAKVEVDVRIDEVVLKSLEREPERRYQHASEVKSDVDAVTSSHRSTASAAQASADSDLDRLIRRMVHDNKGLEAIRAYRAATGSSLSEASAAVKRIAAAEGLPLVRLSTSRRFKEIAVASLAIAIGMSIGEFQDYLVIRIFALIAYVVFLIGHAVGARRERTLQPASGRGAGQDPSSVAPPASAKTSAAPSLPEPSPQAPAPEPATRPPLGFGFAVAGVFVLAWFVAGALRYFGAFGLAAAIAVMALVTYAVLRRKLVYLPTLNAELSRQSRASRRAALTVSLTLFALGMLAVNGFLADGYNWFVMPRRAPDKTMRAVNQLLGSGKLQDHVSQFERVVSYPGGYNAPSFSPEERLGVMAYGVGGVILLFGAVATALATRKYQYSWSLHLRPALHVVLLLVLTLPLPVLADYSAGALLGWFHGFGREPPRLTRAAVTVESFRETVLDWASEHDYDAYGQGHGGVGGFSFASYELIPQSSFDRCQFTWGLIVRPKPRFTVTCWEPDDGSQSYIVVELPFSGMGTSEEVSWPKVVASLETAISGGAPTAQEGSQRNAFYELGHEAATAFDNGDFELAADKAESYLELAAKFPDDWNYGNAIHDGNALLGRLALTRGEIDEAKRRLERAGKATATPQLSNFGPDLKLAANLLALGERQAVLDYLAACKSLWTDGHETIDRFIETIEQEETPLEFRLVARLPLLGEWIADAGLPDGNLPRQMIEFADDGRATLMTYLSYDTTFRREATKVIIADPTTPERRENDIVLEFREGRLLAPEGEDDGAPFATPDGFRPVGQEDAGAALAGRWTGAVRFEGLGAGEMTWEFDDNDAGKCTMELRAPGAVEARYAAIGDRLVYVLTLDVARLLPPNMPASEAAGVLRRTSGWHIEDDVLTIDNFWIPDPATGNRRAFRRVGE